MLDYKRRSDGKLKGKMASDMTTSMITSNEPVSKKQKTDNAHLIDDIEDDHSQDSSSEIDTDFGIGRHNPIMEITCYDLRSSRVDWFRGYMGMIERREGFSIHLVRIKDGVVLKPKRTLHDWLLTNLAFYDDSAWKTRVQELMLSPMSQYLELLPEPARPKQSDLTRSFADNVIHLSYMMAYAFTNYDEEHEDKYSSVILPRMVLRFYEFIFSFGCFTEDTSFGNGIQRQELNMRDMHIRERRLLADVLLQYTKFSNARLRQRGDDVSSSTARRQFHTCTGYLEFSYRGERLDCKFWDKLEAYAMGKYKGCRTGLRQLSYILVSQGLKMSSHDFCFPEYDGSKVDYYFARRMAFLAAAEC